MTKRQNIDIPSIIESAVAAAIDVYARDSEAERQAALQNRIENDLESSVGNEKQLEVEDDVSDPTSMGAPKRSSGLPPEQIKSKGAEIIDADAVIDKFNIIRSGRSLNDRDIKDLMKKYLGSLAPQQMQGVYAILQRISSIVAPTIDATRQHPPKEEPTAVTNARLKMLQQKQASVSKSIEQPAVEPERQPEPELDHDDSSEDITPPIRVRNKELP